MKVLFATKNPAKIKKYSEDLEKKEIEVLTAKKLNIDIKPDENGKNALENAYIKAKAYYDATKIPSIGIDNCLYIEELPEEKQPGTHVRRVNGKELTDDEMIEYYTSLVKENGDKLTAKWIFGMVLYDGKEKYEYSWSKGHFYFVDKPCTTRNPGYPLDSITIVPEYNKYLVELTDEDRKENGKDIFKNDVIDFIVNNLKDEY